jgi:hypothetical protein
MVVVVVVVALVLGLFCEWLKACLMSKSEEGGGEKARRNSHFVNAGVELKIEPSRCVYGRRLARLFLGQSHSILYIIYMEMFPLWRANSISNNYWLTRAEESF